MSTMMLIVRFPPPQACDNCRHRKAKCDEAKPACGSCKEANIPCNYKEVAPPKYVLPLCVGVLDEGTPVC